jgi:hypothetical protein
MTKENIPAAPPLFSRFILWEILGIVGFLHILQYAPANDPTPLFFLTNAVVFAALYPVFYFYNQLKLPLVMRFLAFPLSVTLRILLMVSCGIWITYTLYATGFFLGQASCYLVVRDYWMFILPFYVFDYFFFLEHLLGLSDTQLNFWTSLGMISDAVSGVVGGYYLGRVLITKWGMFFGDFEVQTLLWIILILVSIVAVILFFKKTRKG